MSVPHNTPDQPSLYHTSHSPSSNPTILLIHGACTTSSNWSLIIPHLPTYHLLIPDLPGHGQSSHIPFSLTSSASLLAKLIKRYAHEGKAHIIGHSLGANIAVELIARFPEVVNSVFISGFAKYPPSEFTWVFPYFFWMDNRISKIVPKAVIEWLMDGTDLGSSPSPSLSLCRQIAPALLDINPWPQPWKARTLIVVAGKSGILPTSDRLEDAIKLSRIGKEGNTETKVVTHPLMRHPWNRQDPELFARTATAWFEGGDIPEGFVVV